jgi:hypothetical protein
LAPILQDALSLTGVSVKLKSALPLHLPWWKLNLVMKSHAGR